MAHKRGKAQLVWDLIRQKILKPAYLEAGITRCELGYEGCFRDNFLGFAHAKKRRLIGNVYEFCDCVLACNACHDRIESMSHVDMEGAVHITQSHRKKQPILNFGLADKLYTK